MPIAIMANRLTDWKTASKKRAGYWRSWRNSRLTLMRSPANWKMRGLKSSISRLTVWWRLSKKSAAKL